MSLTMKHLIRRGLGAFVMAAGATLAVAAAGGEEPLKPSASFAIDRDLSGKHPNKPAKDSERHCLPGSGRRRLAALRGHQRRGFLGATGDAARPQHDRGRCGPADRRQAA